MLSTHPGTRSHKHYPVAPEVLRWVPGLSFIAMAIWTMIPDEIEEDETQVAK
jgi:Ca2+/H+ antiporter, TMEM165/GDT1 family